MDILVLTDTYCVSLESGFSPVTGAQSSRQGLYWIYQGRAIFLQWHSISGFLSDHQFSSEVWHKFWAEIMRQVSLIINCASHIHRVPSREGKFWGHDREGEQGCHPQGMEVLLRPVCSRANFPPDPDTPECTERSRQTPNARAKANVPTTEPQGGKKNPDHKYYSAFVKIKIIYNIYFFGEL